MSFPPSARIAMRALGEGISLARKKRRISTMSMAERADIARATLAKIEKGDPSVSLGNYAAVLSILGLEYRLGEITSVERDELGLTLDAERLPKRIRKRKVEHP